MNAGAVPATGLNAQKPIATDAESPTGDPMQLQTWITLIGGLAVFLFGMKLLSESLQELAGSSLRGLLQAMTRNRFLAMFSGLLITIGIQSSSATTVMVVGFVNAGLLKLGEAVGVIMGANIGTTVTAWLISWLGFKVDVTAFALPAIAVGVGLQFLGKGRVRDSGGALIGFGFLFLGLLFLKSSVPDAAKDPESFAFLRQYTDMGFGTTLLFVLIGTLLTIVIQSSSATAAITITLAYNGQIPLEAALGMILGENVGTTITANLAAIAGNRNSKKAALAHTFFNVFGVFWALALFVPLLNFVTWLFPADSGADIEVTRYQISAFHTTFNLINTALLIGFTTPFAAFVSGLVDRLAGGDEKETRGKLTHLSAGPVATASFGLFEIEASTRKSVMAATRAWERSATLIKKGYSGRRARRILDTESALDDYYARSVHFLNDLQESGLHGQQGKRVLSALELITALEDMSDGCADLSRRLRRAHKRSVELGREDLERLKRLTKLIQKQVDLLKKGAGPDQHADRRKESFGCFRREIKSVEEKLSRVAGRRAAAQQLVRDLLRTLDRISEQVEHAGRARIA